MTRGGASECARQTPDPARARLWITACALGAALAACGPECRETLAGPVEIGLEAVNGFVPVQNGGWFRLNFGPQGGVDTTIAVRADVSALRNPRVAIRILDAATNAPLAESPARPVDGVGGVAIESRFIVFERYHMAVTARVVADVTGDDGRCEHGEVLVQITPAEPNGDAGRD